MITGKSVLFRKLLGFISFQLSGVNAILYVQRSIPLHLLLNLEPSEAFELTPQQRTQPREGTRHNQDGSLTSQKMSLLQDVWNRLKVQCRKQLCDVWNPNMTPVCRKTSLSSLCNLGFHFSISICDLALQSGPPTLKLGSHTLTFRHGQWVRHGTAREKARLQGLRWRLQRLEEENRELKLRLEILIDLLVDATVYMHTLEREVCQMERVRQVRHPEKNVLLPKGRVHQ
ncbi:hypothetical protein MHYP_G00109870 [Metynnis hypsauchen]